MVHVRSVAQTANRLQARPYSWRMEIIPDTKNWTWVLDAPCPECGLDTRALDRTAVPQIVTGNAVGWQPVLDRPDVRDRPEPTVWSPLEYACHVRDVFRVFGERLRRMLTEDDPLFANWDQDETAVAERYGEQDPALVGPALRDAAAAVAARFAGVTGAQWDRPGRRTDGTVFTVDSFARYFVHDPIHHLYDVTGRRTDH